MGRRKRKGVHGGRIRKKPQKLDKVFDCPFCQHEKSVKIKLGRGRARGSLYCQRCGVQCERSIIHLDRGDRPNLDRDKMCSLCGSIVAWKASKHEIARARTSSSVNTTTAAAAASRRLDGDDDDSDEVNAVLRSRSTRPRERLSNTKRKSRKRSMFDSA